MTSYRRPQYTREVLDALAQCDGVGDRKLLPNVEPGNAEVLTSFRDFHACDCGLVVNERRLGLTSGYNKPKSESQNQSKATSAKPVRSGDRGPGRRPQAPRMAHDQLVYPQPEVFHPQLSLTVPANAKETVSGTQPHPEHRLRVRRKKPHNGVVSGESPDAVGGGWKRGGAVFACVLPGELRVQAAFALY